MDNVKQYVLVDYDDNNWNGYTKVDRKNKRI